MFKRVSTFLFVFVAFLMLAVQTAHANNPPAPVPDPEPTASTTSDADATASAAASAAALAAQQQQQLATSGSTARAEGGSGVGTVYGDTSRYTNRSLALSLTGMAAAPAVAGDCLEYGRGGGVFGIGVTGNAKLNDACMDDRRRAQWVTACLAVADRYAAAGMSASLAAQLEKCGGVYSAPAAPTSAVGKINISTPPPVATPPAVTREDLQQLEQRVGERIDRAFQRGMGK